MENNCYNVDFAGAVHNVVNLNLSDYATNVDYIPIGLQDSVLLTDVAYNRFYVDNEHVFVVAPGLETIYMFDKTSKLIKSVGKRGRAKGEYSVTRGIVSDSDAGKFIDMSSKCNSARMKEVASSLTYESNPVLIEVTLK